MGSIFEFVCDREKTMGYLLLVLATGTNLVEHTFQKTYSKKHGNGGILFTAFVALFSFLFFLWKYLITDTCKTDFTMALLPYALAGAFCYCVASVAAYIAYQTGPFAITGLIFSFSIMLTSGFGIIFFDEPYSVWTFVAFALVIVSLLLIKAPKGKEDADQNRDDKKVSAIWLAAVIINLILSPAYSILVKWQQREFNNTVNNEFVLIAIGLSAAVLFAVGFAMAKKESKNIIKTCFPYASTAGLANGANNMLTIVLNTLFPLSVISPTRSIMTKAASLAIAYFVFKERFTVRQMIGIIVGVVAIVLLNVATM